MKRIIGALGKYLDDLLVLAGIGFLIRAGYMMGELWGTVAAGAGCIAYGMIVAKGGMR